MSQIVRRLQRKIRSGWSDYEGPTWLVAAAVYGGWFSLVWFHARLPWWLIVPLGGVAIAWHNSLQHETIHALVHIPRRVRFALGFPPLGVLVPYQVYYRSHREHHRDARLTEPDEDPESYYHREYDWHRYPRAIRAAYRLNQTLLGRLTIGPLLYGRALFKREVGRVAAGDVSNLCAWAWHAVCVALLLFWVADIAGMPLWQYLCLMVYPGLSVGMLRSFLEHRYAERPQHRTAIVECGFPLNVLFLNNNLHVVHHLLPTLPWYRIPEVWRASRDELLAHNGGFYFASYAGIAARYAFRPAFDPTHAGGTSAPTMQRVRILPADAT